ncbi:MAG: DUF4914 family protein [Firmicutes bacterium]|nr:DUF4914 family protein [Bacillota bacterium]
MYKNPLDRIVLNEELQEALGQSDRLIIPESRQQLIEMAVGYDARGYYEVVSEIPSNGKILEATVAKCKNGVVANYQDVYMSRRDPDAIINADDKPTDKVRYKDKYGEDFETLRKSTLKWLSSQHLIVMPFMAGGSKEHGYPAPLIAPENNAFFVTALVDLQGFIPASEVPDSFKPRSIIYLAPPFRHTHFGGKQVVLHNRLENMHEIFSYNLYPVPSAKKGVYGMLLTIGEEEGWITAHASTVKVISPYDNVITFMHEGASGGGKSEMIEEVHRQIDGEILLAVNTVTNGNFYFEMSDTCELHPVTDDMALCHPKLQKNNKKLVVQDAEACWFLRIKHITDYGMAPHYERLTIKPKEPLVFLNIDGVPGSTCLIWDHTLDEPGKPCPNPRVIMPRTFIPNNVDEPVEVDIRSFGVRTPPCTAENPSYGITGLFHVLYPALAWLRRLVAPRGYDNPSIIESNSGMSSEGVGSYWPFATERMVDQANLLLEQILNTLSTRYLLVPNQHIGAYRVGFPGQWITREYMARRGSARLRPEQKVPARCSLL